MIALFLCVKNTTIYIIKYLIKEHLLCFHQWEQIEDMRVFNEAAQTPDEICISFCFARQCKYCGKIQVKHRLRHNHGWQNIKNFVTTEQSIPYVIDGIKINRTVVKAGTPIVRRL